MLAAEGVSGIFQLLDSWDVRVDLVVVTFNYRARIESLLQVI